MKYMPLWCERFMTGKAVDLPDKEFKAYMLVLVQLHWTEEPVTDVQMRRLLGVSQRGWEFVRDRLVAKGHLHAVKGGWSNGRAETEIADYNARLDQLRENASKGGKSTARKTREMAQRAAVADLFEATGSSPSSARVRAEFVASSSKTQHELDASDANFPKENNDHPVATATLEEQEQEQEQDNPPKDTPSGKRKQPLPPGWEPPTYDELTERTRVQVDTWPKGQFEVERGKFLNDAESEGRRHINWDAAFRKWCDNATTYMSQRRNGNGYLKPAGAKVPKLEHNPEPCPPGFYLSEIFGCFMPIEGQRPDDSQPPPPQLEGPK